MDKKEMYWVLGIFLITVLFTGLLFNFNYIDAVDVQLHDTYIVVLPLHFCLILWSILTFIIFSIRGLSNRFSNRTVLFVLVVTNSLLTILILIITYATYSFFTMDAFFDLFRDPKEIDTISDQFTRAMIICIGLILLFSIVEFLLIKRLMKLRKLGQSSEQAETR